MLQTSPQIELGDLSPLQQFAHRAALVVELARQRDAGLFLAGLLQVGLDGAPPLGGGGDRRRRLVLGLLGSEGEEEVGDDRLLGGRELTVPEDGDAEVAVEQEAVVVLRHHGRRLVQGGELPRSGTEVG